MKTNILFALILALLLVLSVFQAMQIEGIKTELKYRVTGTAGALATGSSSQKSTVSSSGSAMVGGC